MEFCRELAAPGRGIYRKNGIPLGVTSSWMKNPPEEWNSAWNHWLMDMDSVRKDQKSFDCKNSRNINSKGSLPHKTNFLIFKYENFILDRPYYHSWASASVKLTPALAFWHLSSQSGTAVKKCRTASFYSCTGSVPVSLVFRSPVSD
jgi:hypothetical protein